MTKSYDILIVGGGPAGLSCGQYSARAGRKTAIIEEMAAGGQTMIIDEIENYPGLGKVSGYEIAAAFEKQANGFGCEFIYGTVNSIRKLEDTTFMPGLVLMICSAGRSMSPVVCAAPDTSPSASPSFTMRMP